MRNDKAMLVAEQMIDFYYEKQQQENIRRYNFLQKKKVLKQKKHYMIAFSIAGVMLALLCFIMIFLEIQVREKSQNISAMQIEISELKNENTDAMKRLSDSADYKMVREKANKLGMSHADKDRIIYYDIPEGDYMIQTEDIPKN